MMVHPADASPADADVNVIDLGTLAGPLTEITMLCIPSIDGDTELTNQVPAATTL